MFISPGFISSISYSLPNFKWKYLFLSSSLLLQMTQTWCETMLLKQRFLYFPFPYSMWSAKTMFFLVQLSKSYLTYINQMWKNREIEGLRKRVGKVWRTSSVFCRGVAGTHAASFWGSWLGESLWEKIRDQHRWCCGRHLLQNNWSKNQYKWSFHLKLLNFTFVHRRAMEQIFLEAFPKPGYS